MRKINKTLFNSANYSGDNFYEDYKYNCTLNDTDFTQIGFEQYQSDIMDNDFNDLMRKFDSLYKNNSFVITGTLNLWNGRKKIYPVKIISLSSAIKKCIGRSTEYLSIKQVNGNIEVKCAHHDGTNEFIINLLNERGERTKKGDISQKVYHKAIQEIII